MTKIRFRNSDSAHDFNNRIGAGRVDCEADGENTLYTVDTGNATWDEDNPYGDEEMDWDEEFGWDDGFEWDEEI